MIDIRTEQLLPVKDLPDYLQSRGFGKRVTMRAVNRWIRAGCNGRVLEVVRIDTSVLTSLEAVQRWVEAQSVVGGNQPVGALVADVRLEVPPPAATPEHQASMQFLVESRVVPTELDSVVQALPGHSRSTLAFAAGVLFRVGLRTPQDARESGLEGMLAAPGLGPKSVGVVRDLWAALNGESDRA